MATTTITNLPTVTSLTGNEPLLGVQNGNSVQITTGQIAKLSGATSGYLLSSVTQLANNPIIGTPSTSTYLRGDGTWAAVSASATSIAVGITTVTSSTSGYILYNNAGTLGNLATTGSGSVTLNGSPTFTGTVTSPFYLATGDVTGSLSSGAYSYGSLSYSDSNIYLSATSSQNSYTQAILQNTNSGASASVNYLVSNNLGTASTYYGEFGMNSSGFSGTGALAAASAVYLDSTSADLVIGTTTSNAVHFVVNSGATDAATISSSGIFSLGTPLAVGSGGLGISTTPANGFIPIGNGTNYTAAALTAGANITITNASGAITIASTGGGGMVYPSAGIANSTGSAWGTSYSTTGSGTFVALATSPSFTTPTLGAASATSINKVAITAPATSATLTLADTSTLATSGAFSITLTSTATTNVTLPTSGTLATTANINTALPSATASQIYVGTGSAGTAVAASTLPTAAFPALTGDVTNTAGLVATTVGKIGGNAVSLGGAFTLSGAYATTLSVSGTTSLTLPTSGTVIATVTNMAANPVTGTPSSSNFLRGDGTWAAPAGSGTITSSTANQIPVYTAATTIGGSANLTYATGVLTIGVATSQAGSLVLAGGTSGTTTLVVAATTSGTLTLPAGTGTVTALGNTTTGSGNIVLATSPTLATPTLGAASATSINKVAITAPATSATLTLADGSTLATSGANSITFTSSGTTTLTLPTSGTVTALGNTTTGSGTSIVLATSPALTTPSLSAETYSTSATVTAGTNAQGQGALTSDYNVITTTATNPSGVTLPTATVGRRVIVVNKGTNAVSVFPATGGSIDALAANASINLPVSGWMEFDASSTAQWYSTYNITSSASGTVNSGTAGQLTYYATTGTAVSGNANLTYATGALTIGVATSQAGSLVLAGGTSGTTTLVVPATTSGTLTLPAGSGTVTALGNTTTGSGSIVLATSPTLTTPTLGVASATTINKVTITAPATSSTLTIADGKTFTVSNTLTLAGTDSTVMTFPSSTTTVAGLGTTQTFTATNTFSQVNYTNNAVTVTSNAGTVPITYRLNTFTNSSAATMAITMATTSAVDGQMSIVRIYDYSVTPTAQTIGWTNTQNGAVSVPTTSNGSSTQPLTVGFMYNSASSLWRCIASA